MRRRLVWVLVSLLGAACGEASDPIPSTSAPVAAVAVEENRAADDRPVSPEAESRTTATTTTATAQAADPTATTTTAAAIEEENSPPEPGSDRTQPPIEGLGPAASAQVRKTAAMVEAIRGLEFDGLPSITALSHGDFAERVRTEAASGLEMVEVDEALYKLLGLLEPEDDLAALYEKMYSEGVAGFYSSENREMVLRKTGEEFSALETLTLFHELVHAVGDQHFGFGPKLDSLADDQRHDRGFGLLSLVEGDATLSEILYVQGLTASERSALMEEIGEMEDPDLGVPLFMENALYFPYERGFEYVLNTWRTGQWQAVNDLYSDPPVSTEEIFDGARSPGARPIELPRPRGVMPEGYEEIYDYTWGFLDILLMFEQVLGADSALDAALGWGGSRSLVGYEEGGEVVFVWEYVGDSPEEAEELGLLLYDYAVEGMDVAVPARTGSGFSGSAGDYIFVTLLPESLVMVACSDPPVCPQVIAPYLR